MKSAIITKLRAISQPKGVLRIAKQSRDTLVRVYMGQIVAAHSSKVAILSTFAQSLLVTTTIQQVEHAGVRLVREARISVA